MIARLRAVNPAATTMYRLMECGGQTEERNVLLSTQSTRTQAL